MPKSMDIHIKGVGPEWLREQFDTQLEGIVHRETGARAKTSYDWNPHEVAAIPPGWRRVQEILSGAIVEKPADPPPKPTTCTSKTEVVATCSIKDTFERERQTAIDLNAGTVTVTDKTRRTHEHEHTVRVTHEKACKKA